MVANVISLIRILIIPIFIWLLRENMRIPAFFVFLFAVSSDFIDGLISRKFPQKTEIGKILDPLADKFLLMSAFFCLYMFKNLEMRIPFWVLLIIVSRDVIILLGTGLILMMGIKFKIKPTIWGKLTTFFQMITVLAVLLSLNFSFIFWQAAVIFTLFSGYNYIVRGIKIINQGGDVP